MTKAKKTIIKTIFVAMGTVLLVTFSSCKAKLQNTDDKIKVVTTIFPEYDWLMNVASPSNDKIIPNLLIKNGVDVHSYQPSAKDIMDITNADILMYIGGESDKWITDALKNKNNPNMIVLNLMDIIKENLKEEEIVPGMEAEEAEGEDEEEIEYDEHIWFSISNVKECVQKLSEALISLDPENQDGYTSRTNAYLASLDELNQKYKNELENSKLDTIIVCDRFPFRYLVDDYNINYYAAFPGCSAESEASFETVSFLASKIDEIDTNKVIIIESSKDKLAKTIINASSHKLADILVLDSMQSTTLSEIFNGKTYIGAMESNLEILKKALN